MKYKQVSWWKSLVSAFDIREGEVTTSIVGRRKLQGGEVEISGPSPCYNGRGNTDNCVCVCVFYTYMCSYFMYV